MDASTAQILVRSALEAHHLGTITTQDVLLIGDCLEMSWVHAHLVATGVINDRTLRDWTLVQLVAEAVCVELGPANAEAWVPAVVPAGPDPALAGLVDERPETCDHSRDGLVCNCSED